MPVFPRPRTSCARYLSTISKYFFDCSLAALPPLPLLYHILGHHASKKRLSGDWKSALRSRTSCARYKYFFEGFGLMQVLFRCIWSYISTFSMFFPLLCLHRRDIPLMRERSRFLRAQTSQRIAIANISRRKRPAWCTNRAGGPSEMEKTARSSFFLKKNSGFTD